MQNGFRCGIIAQSVQLFGQHNERRVCFKPKLLQLGFRDRREVTAVQAIDGNTLLHGSERPVLYPRVGWSVLVADFDPGFGPARAVISLIKERLSVPDPEAPVGGKFKPSA